MIGLFFSSIVTVSFPGHGVPPLDHLNRRRDGHDHRKDAPPITGGGCIPATITPGWMSDNSRACPTPLSKGYYTEYDAK